MLYLVINIGWEKKTDGFLQVPQANLSWHLHANKRIAVGPQKFQDFAFLKCNLSPPISDEP